MLNEQPKKPENKKYSRTELRLHLAKILYIVKDLKESIDITLRGRITAHLVPIENNGTGQITKNRRVSTSELKKHTSKIVGIVEDTKASIDVTYNKELIAQIIPTESTEEEPTPPISEIAESESNSEPEREIDPDQLAKLTELLDSRKESSDVLDFSLEEAFNLIEVDQSELEPQYQVTRPYVLELNDALSRFGLTPAALFGKEKVEDRTVKIEIVGCCLAIGEELIRAMGVEKYDSVRNKMQNAYFRKVDSKYLAEQPIYKAGKDYCNERGKSGYWYSKPALWLSELMFLAMNPHITYRIIEYISDVKIKPKSLADWIKYLETQAKRKEKTAKLQKKAEDKLEVTKLDPELIDPQKIKPLLEAIASIPLAVHKMQNKTLNRAKNFATPFVTPFGGKSKEVMLETLKYFENIDADYIIKLTEDIVANSGKNDPMLKRSAGALKQILDLIEELKGKSTRMRKTDARIEGSKVKLLNIIVEPKKDDPTTALIKIIDCINPALICQSLELGDLSALVQDCAKLDITDEVKIRKVVEESKNGSANRKKTPHELRANYIMACLLIDVLPKLFPDLNKEAKKLKKKKNKT